MEVLHIQASVFMPMEEADVYVPAYIKICCLLRSEETDIAG